VNDEARSFIRRSHQKYDVIQAGYIDTYAATAAGAFSLTENTLYTVEAYQDYLSHLSPNGIVAIQRYFEDPPQQSIRLISLALAALKQRGDARPAAHIVVVREGDRASVLVKNSEFTAAEVARIEEHIALSGFELIAAPGRAGVGLYGQLLNTPDFESVIRGYQLDISPVSDDRPFFFYVVKPSQFWRGLLLHTGEFVNARAVFLLTSLMLVALILAVLMVLVPALIARPRPPAAATPAMVYFAALGLGFMLVEIGMLQRLMLFLGHPTLALGVVLTTVLIAAGLGSWVTRGVTLERSDAVARGFLIAVLVAVAMVAFLWPPMFRAFIGMERIGRIGTAIAVLLPVGFLMGTAMPLGLRRLADGRAELIPWAWAVNGAASVLGSVLAMVVAINNGFTATLVLGGIVYAVALVLIGATRAKTSGA
jgi:predicted membrane-bound spermidine synthase